jgi:hypothetical protein
VPQWFAIAFASTPLQKVLVFAFGASEQLLEPAIESIKRN